MESNNNIFCVSDPTKILEALWGLIQRDSADFSDCLIFVPSRRAVRSVEKLLVEKKGSAVLLPKLVPLGEEPDEEPDENYLDTVSNQERIIVLAALLSKYENINTIASALPVARDLVRMQDYLENENIDPSEINWQEIVDERYASHFQSKAEFLHLVSNFLPTIFPNKVTTSKKRNDGIRDWVRFFGDYKKIIVCGSTASVPATSDLMVSVYKQDNGYIILPGKISGEIADFELDTNPYNSEYKFLKRINVSPDKVNVIDLGTSAIDFFNSAFGNSGEFDNSQLPAAQLVECDRESEEAAAVAEIASRAILDSKTVLIITPDAAGNQRISTALSARGIGADFSGGKSGSMTLMGRAILNLFDDWIEAKSNVFEKKFEDNNFDLFKTLIGIIDNLPDFYSDEFDDEVNDLWNAISELSDRLFNNGVKPNISDVRALISDALSGVSVRPPLSDDVKISVLGTIESRMQTADIVILTGLNEGMFPAIGYENPWLPRMVAEKIGLPPGNRKVSLMALDFMTLSCGGQVYWLRSRSAGSSQTTESRFISRVDVAMRGVQKNTDILSVVRDQDNVPYVPLDYSPPRPPSDRSDVYVTELELLIHNPYAFYVRHILRLYKEDDYWAMPDARDFGNLAHSVIEAANEKWTTEKLVNEMDRRALEILPMGSVLFHFWHKRFVEIAPEVEKMLKASIGAFSEIRGSVNIAGRTVRAKADRIWNGVVMDIKTGAAPSKKQLMDGNMPQLPLEAYMMQSGGFKQVRSQTPVLQFLQLQNNNVKLIEYSGLDAKQMIDASVQKASELFGRYSNDYEPYEYYETSDPKYKVYDDLARIND